jgi:hypothetical protein
MSVRRSLRSEASHMPERAGRGDCCRTMGSQGKGLEFSAALRLRRKSRGESSSYWWEKLGPEICQKKENCARTAGQGDQCQGQNLEHNVPSESELSRRLLLPWHTVCRRGEKQGGRSRRLKMWVPAVVSATEALIREMDQKVL